MMDEKRRMYDNMSEIKKGPWKEEEDKVLLSHVKKYGPRDWSSIRSKGLLRRTGKSCRLRWVNKLRPNLKTGIRFSAEEERTIIDLQAQYGNKWARIATYLPGRTDNDVKNFWSSQKKRLARILQTTPSSSDKQVEASGIHAPSFEALEFNSGKQREDVFGRDFKQQEGNRLTDLIHPTSLNFEESLYQLEFDPNDLKPYNLLQSSIPFPPQLNLDFPSLENQEFISRFEVPNFFDVFGQGSASEIGNVHLPPTPSCLEPEKSSPNVTPDISLIDDFPPMDIFDHIDPFQSPSEW
ncbi:transcription factor DUO1-like [Olea europaea subsp. europaea]|uniref:Transcription factor DUO1-like n=1 Tax=Olea europaea subsp. europaea TaxID=158383 RepID=A0A8S0PH07_OLEEU|nr:transcription factor DUO1-like [Olea europaea subsp. europaea]